MFLDAWAHTLGVKGLPLGYFLLDLRRGAAADKKRADKGLTQTEIGAKIIKVWAFLSSILQMRAPKVISDQAARVVKSVRSVPPLPTVAKAK